MSQFKSEIYDIVNENICLFNERYVNLFKKKEKEKYVAEILKMLHKSYAAIGGIKGLDNDDELTDDDTTWIKCDVDTKNNHIRALVVYSSEVKNMRKVRFVAQDGTAEGKKALYRMIEDDFKRPERKNLFAECSTEKMVAINLKRGAIPVPAKIAKETLDMYNKKIKEFRDDGYFYTRVIGSVPLTKVLLINSTDSMADEDEKKRL